MREKFTPLLHKDAIDSTVCSHKKAVPNLFTILSKGHPWIDPWDGIDFTAIPLCEGFDESRRRIECNNGVYIYDKERKINPSAKGGEWKCDIPDICCRH